MRGLFHEMLKRRFLGLRGAMDCGYLLLCGGVAPAVQSGLCPEPRKGLLAPLTPRQPSVAGRALCPRFEHYPTLRFNEPCSPDLEDYLMNSTFLTKDKFSEGVWGKTLFKGSPPAGSRGGAPCGGAGGRAPCRWAPVPRNGAHSPLGFFSMKLQPSAHISSMPYLASQPKSCFAFEQSA